MRWMRAHRWALITLPVAAAALLAAVWFLSIVPNAQPATVNERVKAGESADFGGFRFDDFEFDQIDSPSILPDGVDTYELRVDFEPIAKSEEDLTCSQVSLVETGGDRREFRALNDYEVLRELDAYLLDCIGGFELEPGTNQVFFVVPEDLGPVELVIGYPRSDTMTVPLDG